MGIIRVGRGKMGGWGEGGLGGIGWEIEGEECRDQGIFKTS
jgi:hypothetical protein